MIWCNKMGKVEGKDGFRVTKNTKVCHVHFKNEDVLKVPGGSRWKLREGCLLYTSPSPRDQRGSRMPSSA